MSGWEIHEGLLELDECSALQWFGQEIGNHLLSWAVFHDEITMGDVVGDEEVAHVKMSCVLGTQQSAVLFEEDGAMVVLMEGGFFEIKTLSMEKTVGPKQNGHGVVSHNKLSLGGALGVELLFQKT